MRETELCRWPERIIAALFGAVLSMLISGNGQWLFLPSHRVVGRLLHSVTSGEDHENEEEIEEEIEEEEDEENENLDATVVTSIVLLLIVLTIAFEVFKETLEEKATRSMRVIIEKLFGELTVLGFLSMFTFIMTEAGFFSVLSAALFGDEMELLEIFEFVHFTIFFIMVAFVVQVLVLVVEATRIQSEWEQYEKEVAQQEAEGSFITDNRKKLEKTILRGLKEEFLLNRSVEDPFKPAEESTRLPPEFSFSRYLAISMASILAHTVEVHVSTWAFFAFLTVLYYLFCLAVHEDPTILSWTWAGIGWFVCLSNLLFERHLTKVREGFLLPAVVKESQGGDRNGHHRADETSPLNEPLDASGTHPSDLPLWCNIDMDRYIEKRSWLTSYFVGGKPNRQESLFWMDRKGPHLYLSILQVNILFVGLYAALLILQYIGFMHSEFSVTVFVTYVFVSLVPLATIIVHKKKIITVLTQVSSVGVHRNPKFISDVIREEKTIQIIRSFEVIYKLGKFASAAGSKEHDPTTARRLLEQLDLSELHEVKQTFEAFDSSGDGSISHEEFKALMTNLGANVTDENASKMLDALDRDGSGEVSREEFLAWYAGHCSSEDEEEEISLHDKAKFLFGIFDSNDSGSITIGELMQKLEVLKITFTIDELGAIVNELDEDNSGNISLHEFTEMFEKYGE